MRFQASNSLPSRFNRGLFCFGIVLVSLNSAIDTAGAQSNHGCRPATAPDSTAQSIRTEAISILADTSVGPQSIRAEYGIPVGTATDVSIVQADSTCIAAMAALEMLSGKSFPEAFVIVRMGQSAPFFYLMTPRREGALSTRYLLNGQFVLLTMIGGDG
jgi:hypothetical protein